MNKNEKGFTLIELMIVIAIIVHSLQHTGRGRTTLRPSQIWKMPRQPRKLIMWTFRPIVTTRMYLLARPMVSTSRRLEMHQLILTSQRVIQRSIPWTLITRQETRAIPLQAPADQFRRRTKSSIRGQGERVFSLPFFRFYFISWMFTCFFWAIHSIH